MPQFKINGSRQIIFMHRFADASPALAIILPRAI
jgi:hypothetical protein